MSVRWPSESAATDAEVAAAVAAEAAARTAVIDAHATDTTGVHGIADTSVLATDTEVSVAVAAEAVARAEADALKVDVADVGEAGGVAALDAEGRVLDGSGVPVESTVDVSTFADGEQAVWDAEQGKLVGTPPATGNADLRPLITGTVQVGQTLTASAPDGVVGATWQWTRDGANIAGATSSTYTLVTADNGKLVSVKMTITAFGAEPVTVPAVPVEVITPAATFNIGLTNTAQLSTVGAVNETHRVIRTALLDGTGLKARIANLRSGATDTYTVRYAIERTLGATPELLTFAGENSVTIPARTVVNSDVLADFAFVQGQQFAERAHVVVGSSGRLLLGAHNLGGTNKGGKVAGDSLLSGTIANSAAFLFGAVAIICTTPGEEIPTVAVVTDSYGEHWPAALLEGTYASLFLSRSGEGATEAAATARLADIMLMADGVKTVIEGYGPNDLTASRTVAGIINARLTIAKAFRANGVRVIPYTIAPRTTSTDNWATVANQTQSTAINEANRVLINDWFRAGAPIDPTTETYVAIGTSGAKLATDAGHPYYWPGVATAADTYFDQADVLETARNSGIFKAGYSNDGLHANTTAAKNAMVAAFPVSRFV